MNQASLYQRANQVQRHDAKLILDEFASTLQWRSDEQDSLLDVGSGSGNVLMDFVYPLLPKSYEQLVGTDISTKMVNYANKCYQRYARTEFQVLDIGAKQLPNQLKGRFDHVTSFYCLHWVQNLHAAVRNIYELLRTDGGDCLLVFLASSPVFEVYKNLQTCEKWARYMPDVDQFISPLHYSSNPAEQFTQLLSDAGFEHKQVEVRNKVFIYEELRTLRDNIMAICPFLERIPTSQHEEFMDDFIDVVISMNLQQSHPCDSDGNQLAQRFISPYKLVVAYARKSSVVLHNVISETLKDISSLEKSL
ncbi:hypothetical protein KR222_009320 [Zaprionus bogoriensis]|nr:hypothetical protein KR222_009320 [Zaprionus bogoriensis]